MSKKVDGRMGNWQSDGIILGGKRFGSDQLPYFVRTVLQRIQNPEYRKQILVYLDGGPTPSMEAQNAFKAAVMEILLQSH